MDELLDFLELRSHAGLPVRALSGGFQRRLAIALSLMNRPELLILDEPTTGLDPAVRLALWERVRELRADGTTVLLTTHYMDEAERLCDRLAVMTEGRVVADGSPRELILRLLAPEALELVVTEEEERTLLRELNGLRRMRAGGRLVLYVDDAAALLETVRSRDPARGRRPPGRRRPTDEPGGRLPGADGNAPGGRGVRSVLGFSPFALAVWRRNFAMYRRTWKLNLLPNFFEPLLYLVSIGIGVGAYVSEMGGTSYVVVPGAGPGGRGGDERGELRGHLQRLRAHELREGLRGHAHHAHPAGGRAGRRDSLGHDPSHPSTVAASTSLVLIAMAGLAPLADPRCGRVPLIPLTGLLFAAIGIAFSLRIPEHRPVQLLLHALLTPLFLFSDIFFPWRSGCPGSGSTWRRSCPCSTRSACSARPSRESSSWRSFST